MLDHAGRARSQARARPPAAAAEPPRRPRPTFRHARPVSEACCLVAFEPVTSRGSPTTCTGCSGSTTRRWRLTDRARRKGPVVRTADWYFLRFHEGLARPRPCYGDGALSRLDRATRRAVAGDRRRIRLLQQRPAGLRRAGRRPLRGARRTRRPRTDPSAESLRRPRGRSVASPGCSRPGAARTTERSSGSRCPRSARSAPSRSTSSSTPPSSGTWARPARRAGRRGHRADGAFGIFNFLAYSTTGAVARQVGAGHRRAAAEQGVDGLLARGRARRRAHRARPRAVAGDRRRDGRVGLGPPVRRHVPAHQPPRRAGAAHRARRRRLPARHPGHAHDARDRGRGERLQPRSRGLSSCTGSTSGSRARRGARCSRSTAPPSRTSWSSLATSGSTSTRSVRPPRRRASGHGAWSAASSWSAPARCWPRSSPPPRSRPRIGDDDVAAHQIAFQVWLFLALSLDAIAIAGQAMIGRFLGADDAGEARGGGAAHDRVGRRRRASCSASLLALARPVLVAAVHRRPRRPGARPAGAADRGG